MLQLSKSSLSFRARALRVVPVALVALLATACIPPLTPASPPPPPPPPPAMFSSVPASHATAMLTRDRTDSYSLTGTNTRMVARAPKTNFASNSRTLFWDRGSVASTNQESCETFSDTNPIIQEGVATRIVQNGSRTRAITVTKNVFFGANWIFNVHVWDTANQPTPFTALAGFDMADVFRPGGTQLPYPWSLCMKVVGSTASFVAWPANLPKPSYNDPTYSRAVNLPAGWSYVGTPGWYIGHLPPGGNAIFKNLSTTKL